MIEIRHPSAPSDRLSDLTLAYSPMVKTKRRKSVKNCIFSLLVMTTIESVVKNKILPALLIPLKSQEIVTFCLRVLLWASLVRQG